ncbi:MAG: Spy/CpxP family protein refolding chaperone [Gallionella sp.]
MNMKNTAFILAFGLCTAYSGSLFAANSPAMKPSATQSSEKSIAHNTEHSDVLKGAMMDKQMCDHMKGMMSKPDGGNMGGMMGGGSGGAKDHQMCDHMKGMMSKPDGGNMGGMMGGGSGSAKDHQMCDHMKGMMNKSDGGNMDGQMCDHMMGMKGGHECGHMAGMKGGYGAGSMMESPHADMVMALDLGSEQRSGINKLSDELRHDNWAVMGLIMDESAILRDLYGAEKRDPSAIGKVYQKIFDLKRRMIEAMIDNQNRVEELLTPEQRAQLKDMRQKMKSMPCNMKQ